MRRDLILRHIKKAINFEKCNFVLNSASSLRSSMQNNWNGNRSRPLTGEMERERGRKRDREEKSGDIKLENSNFSTVNRGEKREREKHCTRMTTAGLEFEAFEKDADAERCNAQEGDDRDSREEGEVSGWQREEKKCSS